LKVRLLDLVSHELPVHVWDLIAEVVAIPRRDSRRASRGSVQNHTIGRKKNNRCVSPGGADGDCSNVEWDSIRLK